jgi:hypothetical protein
MTGALAAVDVKDLASHKPGRLKVENCLDDVGDLTHVPDRVKSPKGLVGLDRVHGRFDDAGRNGIHADAALGVLDGKRSGGSVEAILRQRREHGGHTVNGVIDKAGRDLHDMTAALLLHLGERELRDVEEAGDVDAQHGGEVVRGVLDERLGDEDAGVVDERIDAPEAANDMVGRCTASAMASASR